VLKRGFSPRITQAQVLGSKGKTAIDGPQLAARLGLDDAWAYFSVQRSGKIIKEPDRSGPLPSASEEPTAPTPPATGSEGGVKAPQP
jgi:hypothetical protein